MRTDRVPARVAAASVLSSVLRLLRLKAFLHVCAGKAFKKEELTPDLVQPLSQSGARSAACDPASSALQAPFYHWQQNKLVTRVCVCVLINTYLSETGGSFNTVI